jgi:hypothetical protein
MTTGSLCLDKAASDVMGADDIDQVKDNLRTFVTLVCHLVNESSSVKLEPVFSDARFLQIEVNG